MTYRALLQSELAFSSTLAKVTRSRKIHALDSAFVYSICHHCIVFESVSG
jgi:hypothetical protein